MWIVEVVGGSVDRSVGELVVSWLVCHSVALNYGYLLLVGVQIFRLSVFLLTFDRLC